MIIYIYISSPAAALAALDSFTALLTGAGKKKGSSSMYIIKM